MPKEYSRTSRLGDQMQRDLAQMIQFQLKDPRLGMVTLNHVKVAKDLGYADIYFTVMGAKGESDESIRRQTEKILNDAAGYLRTELAKFMRTRVIPNLRFHYDETIERGMHLTSLIKKARDEDNARHPGDDDAEVQD